MMRLNCLKLLKNESSQDHGRRALRKYFTGFESIQSGYRPKKNVV